ncbi:MAG TPA: polysaccharide biosynthesis/export family protein, partial [Terriglobales bacterium]|nr:polysaccharide biosynthesis/export family protein [Terriglobales bacterium]
IAKPKFPEFASINAARPRTAVSLHVFVIGCTMIASPAWVHADIRRPVAVSPTPLTVKAQVNCKSEGEALPISQSRLKNQPKIVATPSRTRARLKGPVEIPLATFVAAMITLVCAAAQQPIDVPSQSQSPAGYVLGPDDQILIRALYVDEISEKPVSIGTDGYISLPTVGRLRVSGLTVQQLERELTSRLTTYLQDPQVSVSVVEYRSQPVSVLGAVANSGVVQLRGRKTLFEVVSEAGGLKPEAGNVIKITRRKEYGPIPLTSAVADTSGQFNVAEVSVKSVMDARNPQENIEIKPNDVISIPRAELIYVIGAVKRAGGFVLNEREHISVLQALSMAEGLDRVASGGNARILRSSDDGSTRAEIPVDVNKILAGRTRDVPMLANDILFIPDSAAKSATLRGVEAAIQVATGVAIFRR